MKETISTGEAAGLLGVDRRTIRRMVRDGRLRGHRTPGGQHRFSRAEIEALISRAEPDGPSARGLSPALKNRKERVDELALEIQERRLKRDVKRLRDEEAQEEAERQAATEEERRQQAEERAQAQRQQLEHIRQQELRQWRGLVMESFAVVPNDAPPALRSVYYQKVREALNQFDCEASTDVAEATILAVGEEVFGPWQAEEKQAAEQERLAAQARARSAWLNQQMTEAWDRLNSTCACEGLAIPAGNLDVLREALDRKVVAGMQSLTPDSSWSKLDEARRFAIDAVLAPHKEAKAKADQERQAKWRKEQADEDHRRACESVAEWGVVGCDFTPEQQQAAKEAIKTALAKLPVGCGRPAMEAAAAEALAPFKRQAAAAQAARQYLGFLSHLDEFLKEFEVEGEDGWEEMAFSERQELREKIEATLGPALAEEFLEGSLDLADRDAVETFIERFASDYVRKQGRLGQDEEK